MSANGSIDLNAYIRDVPDFPKPGILFKDITPLLGDARAFQATVDRLADHFQDHGIEAVAAAEARGFLFGTPLALRLGVGFIPIRKPGKLPYEKLGVEYVLEYGTDRLEVHGDALTPGRKILLLDDVLATGGTMLACQGPRPPGGGGGRRFRLRDRAGIPGREGEARARRGVQPADVLNPRRPRGVTSMRWPTFRVRSLMAAVVVVALITWGSMMGSRSCEYYGRARIYAEQEDGWRGIAARNRWDSPFASACADYFEGMTRKYRRAMWRPWLRVEPDPWAPGAEEAHRSNLEEIHRERVDSGTIPAMPRPHQQGGEAAHQKAPTKNEK